MKKLTLSLLVAEVDRPGERYIETPLEIQLDLDGGKVVFGDEIRKPKRGRQCVPFNRLASLDDVVVVGEEIDAAFSRG